RRTRGGESICNVVPFRKRLDSLFLFLPLDPPLIDDFDAINLALACFVAGKSFLVPSRNMRECFWSCRAFFQKLLEEGGATVGNLRFRVPNIGFQLNKKQGYKKLNSHTKH